MGTGRSSGDAQEHRHDPDEPKPLWHEH
jgi:hypothetical protein